MEDVNIEETNRTAAAAIVAEAEAVAKNLIDTAARTASRMTESGKVSMTEHDLINALDGYFSNDRKFLDVSRIPLICQDIRGIHDTLKTMKDNQQWAVRLILGAVIMALLGLVLIR